MRLSRFPAQIETFFPSYLPCREDGAHYCRSSSRAFCIAQRGKALLWLSFGAASGVIFGGLHLECLVVSLSSVYVGLDRLAAGEGCHLPLVFILTQSLACALTNAVGLQYTALWELATSALRYARSRGIGRSSLHDTGNFVNSSAVVVCHLVILGVGMRRCDTNTQMQSGCDLSLRVRER